LQPATIEGRLALGHLPLRLRQIRTGGIIFLPADGAIGDEGLVAFDDRLGIVAQRLRALQRSFRLLDLCAIVTRIDLEKRCAGADDRAFLEKPVLDCRFR